jgi:hypothetical protein
MHSRHRRLLFVFSLFAGTIFAAAPHSRAQGGEPRYFAIKNATVVPVSGPRMENATVIIARGVIAAVAKDAPVPEEAWVIDGSGLTIYPGLIDSFNDVGLLAAPTTPGRAAGGDAAPRPISRGPEDRPSATPWRDAADEANLADKRIETWRNGGFTTVVSAPKAGIFPGQAAILDLAGERNGDMVVKSPVAIPVSLQPLSGFANFPGSLMGSLAYVRQVWLDTDWSAKAEAAYEKSPRGVARPRYDRVNSALADALEDHALVLIPANNSIELVRALDLPERWHVTGVIYGGQQSYAVAAEIAARKLPVLIDLKWPEAEKDADPDDVPTLRTLRFRDRAPSSPAELNKAGAKFAFYSGGIATTKDILKAVKKSIDAGLPADAALRALTLSPAEIFGVADRLGSIEKGKIANLVVTDGDLFNEKTKLKWVFVDGQRFTVREPEKPKDPPKGDMTGKWKLNFTTPEGAEESTLDATMAADGSLTGTVTGKRGTSSIINGYLSVNKFSFTINLPIEGSPSDVKFTGTFDGTNLKGVISVPSVGVDIDFTGVKPNSESSAATQEQGSRQGDVR